MRDFFSLCPSLVSLNVYLHHICALIIPLCQHSCITHLKTNCATTQDVQGISRSLPNSESCKLTNCDALPWVISRYHAYWPNIQGVTWKSSNYVLEVTGATIKVFIFSLSLQQRCLKVRVPNVDLAIIVQVLISQVLFNSSMDCHITINRSVEDPKGNEWIATKILNRSLATF